MITGDDVSKQVRYYSQTGWHVGKLIALQKTKGGFVAIIATPIAGQRKKRVPAEDCEIYQEEK